MRIACIHAHPDDAEILAGGTLALLSKLGHQVTIVTMTPGDCGSMTHSAAEIADIRKKEAAAAAALIHAEYRWGGFYDMAVFNDDATRRGVTGLLRDIRPDIVLTASPSDYHADHEATSQLVRDACFAVSIPNYKTPSQAAPLPGIPHLYFVDAIDQRDRNGELIAPEFTVNVEFTFETKKAMLAAHDSQRSWLRQQHGMDNYLIQMEAWTRAIGERAGVAMGEGFRHYHVHPYPHEPLLQQALAGYLS